MKNQQKFKLIFFILIFILTWIFSFFLAEQLIKFTIKEATRQGFEVLTVSPLDSVNMVLETSIYITIGILSPLILIGLYQWVKDALYEKERKIIKGILRWSIISVIGGMMGLLMTYFIIVPFLINYSMYLGLNPTTSLYPLVILFVANFAIMAVIFLIPILLKMLNQLGIIYKEHLKKGRKVFYLIAIIVLAIITPTTDLVSLLIMSIPLIFVYEISILMVKKENLINQ